MNFNRGSEIWKEFRECGRFCRRCGKECQSS
ncbi:four-helix bundle copper-binding protein [Pontibacter harenae]